MITAINLERSPPIEEVIASGVVPRFVEFLTREDYPQLQVRYSWIDRKDPFFYCFFQLIFIHVYLIWIVWAV